MQDSSNSGAVRLPGHTSVAGRALTKVVRAATARELGVPIEAVSASLQADEAPLTVRLNTAVPDSLVAPGVNLVSALSAMRARLQPRLSHLLGAEVGTLSVTVDSIYYSHEVKETETKRNRVE
ncbi:hypothetical protein KRX54_01890 [Actinomycetaceae bacterium TAE3-ERU4]|nr:hypothetical protein [Actinomycetaceae bacterium TAE3-ERU4]